MVWLQGSDVHRLNPRLLQNYIKHYLLETCCLGREGIDACSNDQDKEVKSKVKGKKQIVSNKRKNDPKPKDYVNASSNGLKYSMKAKIPAVYVDK